MYLISCSRFSMLHRFVLCTDCLCPHTASHCIVLYCIVLYCIVLYCIVLYCIVLYCIVLYCIVVLVLIRLWDKFILCVTVKLRNYALLRSCMKRPCSVASRLFGVVQPAISV